jgi:hypothetical protein
MSTQLLLVPQSGWLGAKWTAQNGTDGSGASMTKTGVSLMQTDEGAHGNRQAGRRARKSAIPSAVSTRIQGFVRAKVSTPHDTAPAYPDAMRRTTNSNHKG